MAVLLSVQKFIPIGLYVIYEINNEGARIA